MKISKNYDLHNWLINFCCSLKRNILNTQGHYNRKLESAEATIYLHISIIFELSGPNIKMQTLWFLQVEVKQIKKIISLSNKAFIKIIKILLRENV